MAEFYFPIEAGHMAVFDRAIGYLDGPTIASPTFCTAADQFDPEFNRRPHPLREWPASLPPTRFHAEQRFDYFRRILPGDLLRVRRFQGATWTKEGVNAGRLEFVEEVTECRDDQGRLVIRATWVDMWTQRSHSSLVSGQVDGSLEPHGPASERSDRFEKACARGRIVVDNLSRTQIVMYVGAAGDYHPLHHDEEYALSRGYPSVFAPGMLTMGLVGRAVTESVGLGNLRNFGGRFRAQVWPGDSLAVSADVAPWNEGEVGEIRLTVSAINQHGEVVFDGWVVSCTRMLEE